MEMISQAKDFLEYDTTHESGKYALGFQSYYLLLIFQKPFGDLFTTVRPMYGAYDRRSKSQQQTISKQKYYEGLIGQEFDIIITSARETAPREREPDFNGYSAKEEQERMHWIQQNLK